MSKHSVIFLFLFFFGFISAQQVKWSPVIDDKDYSYLKIIGENEEGFYVLKSNISFEDERDKVGFRGRHYALSFFTNDMVLKWTRELSSPVEEGKIVSINMVDEKVLVTFSLNDKKQKTYRFLAQYLNKEGNYADSSKLVMETEYAKIDTRAKPDIYISQSRARIACAFKTMPVNKKEQSYYTIVMDSSLSILYHKDFNIPYNDKQFVSQNLAVSNEGGFYLFGIRYANDRKVKASGESFYTVYYCNSPSSEMRSEEINAAEAGNTWFLTDASLTYDNVNHKIVVAGFYSGLNAYSIAGTFYYALRTDTTQKAEMRFASFEKNFLMKFHGEIRDKNNKELADYAVNRIILRRDGGAVIIAEGVSSTYSSYYDYFSQMYISHRYYLYGNIMALSVNPDGTILWSDAITKDQESRDDGGYYSSYCANIYGDKMFFVYNKYIGDNPSVLLTTVNSRGDQKTDVFFNEEDHVLAIPAGGKQIAEDEVVMPALKEGKLRFVKVTF